MRLNISKLTTTARSALASLVLLACIPTQVSHATLPFEFDPFLDLAKARLEFKSEQPADGITYDESVDEISGEVTKFLSACQTKGTPRICLNIAREIGIEKVTTAFWISLSGHQLTQGFDCFFGCQARLNFNRNPKTARTWDFERVGNKSNLIKATKPDYLVTLLQPGNETLTIELPHSFIGKKVYSLPIGAIDVGKLLTAEERQVIEGKVSLTKEAETQE